MIRPILTAIFLLAAGMLAAQDAEQRSQEDILKRLRKEAKANNVRAQAELGSVYFYGKLGQKPDAALAVHWYKKAAKANEPVALLNLGICYERGVGVDANPATALSYYRQAADQDVLPAIVNVAFALKDQGDLKTAATYFAKGAERGDRHCQREYGLILLTDLLDKPDYPTARKHLDRAAKTGDHRAALALADFYNGSIDGFPPDPPRAFDLLLQAAEIDLPEALTKVGYCYEEGYGVPRSTAQAVGWYRRAVKLGHPAAMINLADCYRDGRGAAQDVKIAFDLYAAAAKAGHPLGVFNVGVCYAVGTGVDQSDKDAREYFRKAAEMNLPIAQFNLGVYLQEGRGAAPDPVAAAHWFKKAADAAYPPAMNALAECYEAGIGVPRDPELANAWRQKLKSANQ